MESNIQAIIKGFEEFFNTVPASSWKNARVSTLFLAPNGDYWAWPSGSTSVMVRLHQGHYERLEDLDFIKAGGADLDREKNGWRKLY